MVVRKITEKTATHNREAIKAHLLLKAEMTERQKRTNRLKYLHNSKKSCNFAAESCKDNKNEHKIMARPIKETPTLYGEDARRFAYAVEHPRKVTAAEMQRMEESYQMVKSIANFAF